MAINKKNIDEVLKRFNSSIDKEYMLNTSDQNLNNLLNFYKELVPDWKSKYNQFNKRINTSEERGFDELLGAQLPPKRYTIDNLKVSPDNNEGKNSREILIEDIMQRGRIIHLSNKIAHEFEHIFKSRLREYIKINEIKIPNSRGSFKKILSLMRKVYSPTLDDDKKDIAKQELKAFGFRDEDFEEGKLDKCNFEKLILGFNNAMKIKDMEIENVHLLARENKVKEISYGYKEDGTERNGSLFVMDVLNFGQFSVHVKSIDLIEQLKTSPYQMPVYSLETDMLVDHQSKEAREFYDNAISNEEFDEQIGINDKTLEVDKERRRLVEHIKQLDMPKGRKHELGVRYGLGRKQLKRIEAEGEDR